MTLKIEQNIMGNLSHQIAPQESLRAASFTISTIQQASDEPDSTIDCLDLLVDCLSSLIAMIFNLITCAFCCGSKLDKLLGDPRTFLQKLMNLDPDTKDNVFAVIPLNQENTLALSSVDRKTILYYLCLLEGNPIASQELGFEITSEVIQRFISKRGNDFKEDEDSEILHFVKSGATAECLLKIPEFAKRIDKGDSVDSTPLHNAVREGRVDVVRTLVAHQANTELKDRQGEVVWYQINSIEMAKIFIENEHCSEGTRKTLGGQLLGNLVNEGIEKHKELIKYLIVDADVDIYNETLDQLKEIPEFQQLIDWSDYDDYEGDE